MSRSTVLSSLLSQHRRIALATILCTLPLAQFAQADTPLPYQRVSFSTEVAREIPNDQMNAVLSVELSDKDPAVVAQQIATLMNEAHRKATAYPVVKTTSGSQNTWPVYTRSAANPSRLDSWRGRAEIRLESRDFKAASELIAKLQEKLQLNSLSFSVAADTRRKLEDAMTSEAIAAFRARAETVRTSWSASGYRLVDMNLGSAGGPPPYMPMVRAMKAMDGPEAVPAQDLAGGDTRLVVNVSGSIELLP
ncbi:MAG TPA: SIMPL domain-containing protein [Moraxellaceae bacterium]|nr:SIMPL domain-containing protein [Moraxellaceae bacterium]